MQPYENMVTYGSMLIGFTDAAARFDDAVRERDPIRATNSLFEALSWVVALDNRIRQHWVPDGEPLDFDWRERLGLGVAQVMGGVRLAGNRVHHQWSDAMVVTERTYPSEVPEWVWRPVEDLPKGKPDLEGEDGYGKLLDGVPVKLCLDILNGPFFTIWSWIEPHTARAAGQPDLSA